MNLIYKLALLNVQYCINICKHTTKENTSHAFPVHNKRE